MTDQTPGRRSRRPHVGRRADEQTDSGPARNPGAGQDRERSGGFDASTARRWIGPTSAGSAVSAGSADTAASAGSAGSAASAASANTSPATAPSPSRAPSPSAAAPSPGAAPTPLSASSPDESAPRPRGRRAGPPRDERTEMAAASSGTAEPSTRPRARRARRESDDDMDAWSAADSHVVSRDPARREHPADSAASAGSQDRSRGGSEEPPTTVLEPMETPRTSVRLGASSSVTALGPRDAEEESAAPVPADRDEQADGAGSAPSPVASPASPAARQSPVSASSAESPSAAGQDGPEDARGGSRAASGAAVGAAAATTGVAAARTRGSAGAGGGSGSSGGAGSGGGSGSGNPPSDGSDLPGDDGRESGSGDGQGPRARDRRTGSLPRAAGWTVLTSFIPGTGLLATPLRKLGWVLLGIVVLAAVVAGVWYATGDPLLTLLKLLSSRKVLIGLMVAIGVVALVWILQVVLSNLAHNTRERLHGRRRAVSLIVALVMVIGVAVPFARAEQYVYAAQGLLGNQSVFRSGGGSGKLSSSDPWKDTERVNIMLLGQDAGADRTGTRPDTIMVASIDTKTGRTALFSIPRNLQYVRFPEGTVAQKKFPDGFDAFGKGQNLINAVWTWANDNKDLFPNDDDPGLTATEWAVQETLGLDIDYYAMVNLQGFSDLVDAIGGVDLNVERKIPIGGGTNQATGGKYPITGYIDPGQQKLDGNKALWYARSREGSTDFNRVCRQQRMVRAVSEQANPTKLALNFTKLVGVAGSNIETDVPSDDLDAFVDLGWRVKDSGFSSYPIVPGVDLPDRRHDSYFEGGHPDWDYLHNWVKESIEDSMASETTSVSGEKDSSKDKDSKTSTAPEKTTESTTTEAESSKASSDDASKEAEKQADADPLAACMPGTQDPDAQAGD
ncbi:LCP family protein [Brachybacterium sp. ACRRE]|uniref:LCP family protein n=1 Tax=Brachybacterium sp. ACRRE TaxID=2918184 RepID=UPI001EF3AFD0|nr:LCP family protein [Brachybacterium sp. ACRRE]MCG7310470.1 LCP family protein [Brachybacterium sp. ACRRE]